MGVSMPMQVTVAYTELAESYSLALIVTNIYSTKSLINCYIYQSLIVCLYNDVFGACQCNLYQKSLARRVRDAIQT